MPSPYETALREHDLAAHRIAGCALSIINRHRRGEAILLPSLTVLADYVAAYEAASADLDRIWAGVGEPANEEAA